MVAMPTTHHNGGPADVEQRHNCKQHACKLRLHAQLKLLRKYGGCFLDGLAQVTNPAGQDIEKIINP